MDENVEFPIVWALIDSIRAVGRKILLTNSRSTNFCPHGTSSINLGGHLFFVKNIFLIKESTLNVRGE